MADQPQSPTQIAHILFLDIVGWSRESINRQGQLLAELSNLVTESRTFQLAKSAGELLAFPSGDGMWILFKNDLAGPANCAIELAQRLKNSPELAVRMGIHSGPVRFQTDIAGTQTVVGDGINMAKRVMDMGDGGHILLSAQHAVWLKQSDEWTPFVRPFGFGETKHGERIELYALVSEKFGRSDPSTHILPVTPATPRVAPSLGLKLVIVYRRNTQPDDHVLMLLERSLSELGHDVFVDRHLKIGVEWAKAIEDKIRSADAVIVILSSAASGSEMIEFELETANDERQQRGKPFLLPVMVGTQTAIEGAVGAYVKGLNYAAWKGPEDDLKVLAEIQASLYADQKADEPELQLEPVGGAVPPDSPFYEERVSDAEFGKALRANESIILVKGPRQMGKTSLIGRGAKAASELGWRQVFTDFQKLSSSQLSSDDGFYKVLAATLARQLKFKYDFAEEWIDIFGANMNMDNFVRALIDDSQTPLVWFMDEADKLFGVPFASDFFGLVRSWHNSRATEPNGPWSRFTVVIGYATEAHLFIQDLNQSPFNVGRQIALAPFDLDQIWDLNLRYGTPLNSRDQAVLLSHLVGGQPFLIRRALDVLARNQMDFATLMSTADREDGPFADHLKRIFISVTQIPSVHDALRQSLTHPSMSTQTDGLQRLLAAGVLKQTTDNRVVLACELYHRYLSTHMPKSD